MGGINSGRRRSVYSGIVEDAPAIDIRVLRRLGRVRAGEYTYDTLSWARRGLRVASVRVFIDLSAADGTMRIVGSVCGDAIDQRVAIEALPCHLGGSRFYFLCPISGERCEILHYADARFASRKAQRLTYAVKSDDTLSRVRRRRRKLRQRLDGEGMVARPRGPRRQAFEEKLRATESKERSLYLERLARIAASDTAR